MSDALAILKMAKALYVAGVLIGRLANSHLAAGEVISDAMVNAVTDAMDVADKAWVEGDLAVPGGDTTGLAVHGPTSTPKWDPDGFDPGDPV